MKNYIFVIKCYIRSQTNLSLQRTLKFFHINGLNVDMISK